MCFSTKSSAILELYLFSYLLALKLMNFITILFTFRISTCYNWLSTAGSLSLYPPSPNHLRYSTGTAKWHTSAALSCLLSIMSEIIWLIKMRLYCSSTEGSFVHSLGLLSLRLHTPDPDYQTTPQHQYMPYCNTPALLSTTTLPWATINVLHNVVLYQMHWVMDLNTAITVGLLAMAVAKYKWLAKQPYSLGQGTHSQHF